MSSKNLFASHLRAIDDCVPPSPKISHVDKPEPLKCSQGFILAGSPQTNSAHGCVNEYPPPGAVMVPNPLKSGSGACAVLALEEHQRIAEIYNEQAAMDFIEMKDRIGDLEVDLDSVRVLAQELLTALGDVMRERDSALRALAGSRQLSRTATVRTATRRRACVAIGP